jgi:large subunit ribosomal protein L5
MSYTNSFKFHNINIVKYDLLSKFNYKNIHQIPSFNKIVLSFALKELNFKRMLQATAALQLISNQKAVLTNSKKANISLKIRKGAPVGCKITLRKSQLFLFLSKLVLFILPNIKTFEKIRFKHKNLNSLSFLLTDLLVFSELENQYDLFQKLPDLNISIILLCNNTNEVSTFLTSYRFPIN